MEALRDLPLMKDPNLIVGMEHGEDAAVYRLRDDLAIIQTVDFFTPIVDDPYTFGRIAVTNALSDVYAMGGRPLTAMNIVCFPVKRMAMEILKQILRGGLDQMKQAGVLLVGGHSVEDDELKYGLSVTGVVHPDRVLFNRGAKPGDKLILTKPLGTGIVSTAIKGDTAGAMLSAKAIRVMTELNKRAAELMMETPEVHSCTDVTGFGLVGHACEMIEDSDVGMVIRAGAVPFLPEIRELVEMGIIPGGLYRNRRFRQSMVDVSPSCPSWLADVFFDPQTAGGLLIALSCSQSNGLLERLHREGMEDAAIIGEVVAEPRGRIWII